MRRSTRTGDGGTGGENYRSRFIQCYELSESTPRDSGFQEEGRDFQKAELLHLGVQRVSYSKSNSHSLSVTAFPRINEFLAFRCELHKVSP